MDSSKAKSLLVVVEGFVVEVATHWVCAEYFALRLVEMNPAFPWISATAISATISPVVATIYMALRLRSVPLISIKAQTFLSTGASIILAWLGVFVQTLFLGKEISLGQEILETQSQPLYFYLTLTLVGAWGPFVEETLNRGYFFETLRITSGDAIALLVSSLFFVIFHGAFDVVYYGTIGYDLFFIFLHSVIFTAAYILGGLVAAIATHMFVNSYLLYLSMSF